LRQLFGLCAYLLAYQYTLWFKLHYPRIVLVIQAAITHAPHQLTGDGISARGAFACYVMLRDASRTALNSSPASCIPRSSHSAPGQPSLDAEQRHRRPRSPPMQFCSLEPTPNRVQTTDLISCAKLNCT
jgi:hypothetical protein